MSHSQPDLGKENIDSVRMIDQPALRTSNGLVWLLVGGILTVICAGLLVLLSEINPTVAWTGAGAIVALYLAMIVVRFLVRPKRPRLLTLAVLFGLITAIGLVCVLMIAAQQGAALR